MVQLVYKPTMEVDQSNQLLLLTVRFW